MNLSEQATAATVRVFISYSHDSSEHCDQVLAFAQQQLRRDGIDAELDQFHQDELTHWPRWCEEQLRPENSRYVLCVCTAEYKRRVEDRVPADIGKGVFWEASLIYNYLYDEKGNKRCVPILFGAAREDTIPAIFGGWNRYRLTTLRLSDGDPSYEDLYRLLTAKPKVKSELLGECKNLLETGAPCALEQVLPPLLEIPERKTDFMDLIEEVHRKVAHIEQVSTATKADTSEILDLLRDSTLFPESTDPRPTISPGVILPGEKGQLALLRRRVEWFWVKELKEKSLFRRALIELVMEARDDDALDQPWERVLELPDHTRRVLPPQTRAWDVYQECGNALLILGAPGSGKTITLLELAQSLIAAAEGDDDEPVPVVLNLSTWGNTRLSLARWGAEELRARYQVPLAKGRQWLAQGQLVLLLDGMDEVPERHRAACLQAVKTHDLPLPGLVVCSRLDDYLALPMRLNLSAAVCLQPLNPEQVDGWLAQAGLTHLREAIRDDADWRELLKTPLMLSVACLTLAGLGPGPLPADQKRPQSWEASRAALFDRYIERMFAHRVRGAQLWPKETILRWLGWLAQSMLQRSQTALLVENLQPDLFAPGGWRWAYVIASRLLIVLACTVALNPIPHLHFYLAHVLTFTLVFGTAIVVFDGLVLCGLMPLPKSVLAKRFLSLVTQFGGFLALLLLFWVPLKHFFDSAPTETISIAGITHNFGPRGTPTLLGMAVSGLLCWLILGMGAGLRPADSDVRPVASVAWSAKKALKWALIAAGLGFVCLFIWALIVFGWSYDEAPPNITAMVRQKVSSADLVIIQAVFGSLVGGVVGFAPGGWTARLQGKVALSPNQGMRSSLAFSLRMGLVALGLCAPAWIFSSNFGIYVMAQAVPLVVIAFGGHEVIRHTVLRALLAWRGCMPLRYIRFLNHAADLAFLQRSGGAYLFIHRTFQEHLAARHV